MGPISRRALAHLRAATGLARRNRGGQPGNRNRLTHGMYSRACRARRERTRALVRRSHELVALASRAVRARIRHAFFDKLRMRNSVLHGDQKKALILSLSKDEVRPPFHPTQRDTNLPPIRSGERS